MNLEKANAKNQRNSVYSRQDIEVFPLRILTLSKPPNRERQFKILTPLIISPKLIQLFIPISPKKTPTSLSQGLAIWILLYVASSSSVS